MYLRRFSPLRRQGSHLLRFQRYSRRTSPSLFIPDDVVLTDDTLRQPNGVETIHPVGDLAPSEQALLDACLPDLAKNIAAGVNFMKK